MEISTINGQCWMPRVFGHWPLVTGRAPITSANSLCQPPVVFVPSVWAWLHHVRSDIRDHPAQRAKNQTTNGADTLPQHCVVLSVLVFGN